MQVWVRGAGQNLLLDALLGIHEALQGMLVLGGLFLSELTLDEPQVRLVLEPRGDLAELVEGSHLVPENGFQQHHIGLRVLVVGVLHQHLLEGLQRGSELLALEQQLRSSEGGEHIVRSVFQSLKVELEGQRGVAQTVGHLAQDVIALRHDGRKCGKHHGLVSKALDAGQVLHLDGLAKSHTAVAAVAVLADQQTSRDAGRHFHQGEVAKITQTSNGESFDQMSREVLYCVACGGHDGVGGGKVATNAQQVLRHHQVSGDRSGHQQMGTVHQETALGEFKRTPVVKVMVGEQVQGLGIRAVHRIRQRAVLQSMCVTLLSFVSVFGGCNLLH
mmetsp:Transcript_21712/g.37496  ORF Transcript_21712/g.37496 Transcript_21712/m.37496 type:complete len:331 (-) Transcript_21712:206-1198(-)